LLSRMLQFSHSTRTISHMWKTRFERKRMLMHSYVEHRLRRLFELLDDEAQLKKVGKSTN
jgi:hypothetical protein